MLTRRLRRRLVPDHELSVNRSYEHMQGTVRTVFMRRVHFSQFQRAWMPWFVSFIDVDFRDPIVRKRLWKSTLRLDLAQSTKSSWLHTNCREFTILEDKETCGKRSASRSCIVRSWDFSVTSHLWCGHDTRFSSPHKFVTNTYFILLTINNCDVSATMSCGISRWCQRPPLRLGEDLQKMCRFHIH